MSMDIKVVFLVCLALCGTTFGLPSTFNKDEDICTCINEGSEKVVDGYSVKGRYVYIDPLGTKVTVTYSDDGIGIDGYTEKRTFSRDATIDVEEIVRLSTQGIEPEVTKAAREAFKEASVQGADVGVITEAIFVRIRTPLRRKVQAALNNVGSRRDSDQVVFEVINTLRPSVADLINRINGESIIFLDENVEEAVSSSNGDALVGGIAKVIRTIIQQTLNEASRLRVRINGQRENEEDLVATIIAKLIPVIKETVKEEEEEASEGEYDENFVLGETFLKHILAQVLANVDSQVEELFESKRTISTTSSSDAAATTSVMQRLGHFVRVAVRNNFEKKGWKISRSFFQTSPEYPIILENVLSRVKPIVEQKVVEVKGQIIAEQEKTLLSDEFVDAVFENVEESVRRQVRIVLQLRRTIDKSDHEIVNEVVGRLEPILKRGIRTVVNVKKIKLTRDFYKSTTHDLLVAKIVTKLQPVIQSAIEEKRVIIEVRTSKPLDVSQIEADLAPLVVKAALQQFELTETDAVVLEKVLATLTPSAADLISVALANDQTTNLTPEDVLESVLKNLHPIILDNIRLNRGLAQKRQRESLISETVQLMRGEIDALFQTESSLSDDERQRELEIAVQSQVEQIIKERVAGDPNLYFLSLPFAQEEIVNIITSQLATIIHDKITDYAAATRISPGDVAESVEREMEPLVIKATIEELRRSSADSEAVILERVLTELTPAALEFVRNQISGHSGLSEAAILEQVLNNLRPAIIDNVRVNRAQIQDEQRQTLIEETVKTVRSQISSQVRRVTSRRGNRIQHRREVERLIQASVKRIIQRKVRSERKFYFLATSEAQQILVNGVMDQLAVVIQREIEAQAEVAPQVNVRRAGGASGRRPTLTRMFGMSGGNTVSFKSPRYSYAYSTDK